MPTSFEVLTANTEQGEAWDDIVAGMDECDV